MNTNAPSQALLIITYFMPSPYITFELSTRSKQIESLIASRLSGPFSIPQRPPTAMQKRQT